MSYEDRREHVRVDMNRPCKVFLPATSRYCPGRTRNVSEGGALVELDAPRDLKPGDVLELGIAWTNRAILPADALVEAKVVRTVSAVILPDGTTRRTVGVRFDQVEPIAAELLQAA